MVTANPPFKLPLEADCLLMPRVAGQALGVAFSRGTDRIGHTIGVEAACDDGPARFVPLLHSVEGTSQDLWPASSALQSLSIEALPDGRRVALLVGMAGRSHWSASIEANQEQQALIFDLACRTSQTPDFLGSSYRFFPGVELELTTAETPQAALRQGDIRLRLTTETAGPFAPPRIDCQGETIVLQAIPAGQKTVRWKFRLQLG